MGELAEQVPRGKKIDSLKTFGEPVVNRFQQRDGLAWAALIGPQSGEIHRRPQLPGERALLARQRRRLQKESGCRVRSVLARWRQQSLPPQSLGRTPMLLVGIPACELRHQGHSVSMAIRRDCGLT